MPPAVAPCAPRQQEHGDPPCPWRGSRERWAPCARCRSQSGRHPLQSHRPTGHFLLSHQPSWLTAAAGSQQSGAGRSGICGAVSALHCAQPRSRPTPTDPSRGHGVTPGASQPVGFHESVRTRVLHRRVTGTASPPQSRRPRPPRSAHSAACGGVCNTSVRGPRAPFRPARALCHGRGVQVPWTPEGRPGA